MEIRQNTGVEVKVPAGMGRNFGNFKGRRITVWKVKS